MTTADAVANKARIQRGDKATEVDEALNGGAPAFHTAMAKQGVMHGIAVGGCCELSTSAHHLVAKIGEEQGYKLAESSGMDIEDAITIATRLLKGRIAKQVWRDYHKHAFARRCYADPSDMGPKALAELIRQAKNRSEAISPQPQQANCDVCGEAATTKHNSKQKGMRSLCGGCSWWVSRWGGDRPEPYWDRNLDGILLSEEDGNENQQTQKVEHKCNQT